MKDEDEIKEQFIEEQVTASHLREQPVAVPTRRYPTPFRLLIIVTVSIFVAETFVMFLVSILPPLPVYVAMHLDALVLTSLLLPLLYLFLFRPVVLYITEGKRAEEALQKRTYDLGERMKELNCLYGVSRLIVELDRSLDEIFQETIPLIPPSWQYPEITCARIIFEGREVTTANFNETEWKQSADIVVSGKTIGSIEVYYLEEKPAMDEGPFLKEERSLIDALGRQLGDITERKRAEEMLRRRTVLDRVRATVLSMRTPKDIQDVLMELHRQLREVGIRFDNGSVQVIDEKRRESMSYHITSEGVQEIRTENGSLLPLDLESNRAVAEAWREQKVVYRHDLDREDRYGEREHLRGGGGYQSDIRSVVDVPFSHGTIAINSVLPDAFSEGDIETLKQFAGVLSGAYIRYEDIRRIEESEEKYRSVVEHSQDAIFKIDLERNYLLISPVVQKLTGYSPEAFYADRTFGHGIVLPEDLEKAEEGFRKASSGEVSSDVEYRMRTKDGRILWMSQTTFPIRDAGGRIVAIEGTLRDITERKRAEERQAKLLEEVEKANGDLQSFTSIVSHDLRAPLVNIQGFSKRLEGTCTKAIQTLKEISQGIESGDPIENREGDLERLIGEMERKIPPSFDFVFKAVKKMDEMTEQLLQLSRLSTRPAAMKTVDIAGMIQEIVGTMRFQIEEKGIEVTVGPLPRVICEGTRINQVFSNLLSNAIAYIGEDNPAPKTEIGGRDDGDYHVFFIRDNGVGIDKENHEKIFRIFTRVGEDRVSGHGMGLAFVKKIVERHAGRIWVESEKGEGSTFYFTISKHLAQEDVMRDA